MEIRDEGVLQGSTTIEEKFAEALVFKERHGRVVVEGSGSLRLVRVEIDQK